MIQHIHGKQNAIIGRVLLYFGRLISLPYIYIYIICMYICIGIRQLRRLIVFCIARLRWIRAGKRLGEICSTSLRTSFFNVLKCGLSLQFEQSTRLFLREGCSGTCPSCPCMWSDTSETSYVPKKSPSPRKRGAQLQPNLGVNGITNFEAVAQPPSLALFARNLTKGANWWREAKKLNRDGSWVQISSSKDAIVPWIPNYQAMAKTISVSSAMEQVPPAAEFWRCQQGITR